MAATILTAVGYDPHRRYRAGPADYVMVATAIAVALGLVAWALFG
jgi:hypothetical protein